MLVRPDPENDTLYQAVVGIDHTGREAASAVINERPLTIFLNGREIVTAMTIGDYPEYLALGYLLNQNMIGPDDDVTAVEYDAEIETAVVRTNNQTCYEEKLKKKIQTSGCAMGTVFGDVLEKFETVKLDETAKFHTSWLYSLQKSINTMPSLYLKTGAIHGCVLCEKDTPLIYMEDVGRHNAMDKIAGYMHRHGLSAEGKILYTTGRLTSEMVIKTVQMGIPILLSRSGFTAWGVDLAKKAGLTLIGRAKGKRFLALSGANRIVFDADPEQTPDEAAHHGRKGGRDDD